MATRQLLAELVDGYRGRSGRPVALESVGGVDAARRVRAGEDFDVVVLASDAIDTLAATGQVLPASKVDLARSGVAVAVRADAPAPDLSTESSVRQAVLAAAGIGYSTGPSGTALLQLFERWGIAEQLRGRTVQAPPGVPVGALVARGEVALGFQQLSELMHLEGVRVAGLLPPGIQITTTFSAAICRVSVQVEAARELLADLAALQAAATKRRHGMEPA